MLSLALWNNCSMNARFVAADVPDFALLEEYYKLYNLKTSQSLPLPKFDRILITTTKWAIFRLSKKYKLSNVYYLVQHK